MSNLGIENIQGVIRSGGPAEIREPALREPKQADGDSFGKVLENSIAKVNEYQHDADHAIKELVAGRSKNIHETMLAIERADSSLKLMMQVRNKVLEAYREIIRMQV